MQNTVDGEMPMATFTMRALSYHEYLAMLLACLCRFFCAGEGDMSKPSRAAIRFSSNVDIDNVSTIREELGKLFFPCLAHTDQSSALTGSQHYST